MPTPDTIDVLNRVLATLDDRELQAKARQAESALRQAEAGRSQAAAQLELATATHARYRALLEGTAISRQPSQVVSVSLVVEMTVVGMARRRICSSSSRSSKP